MDLHQRLGEIAGPPLPPTTEQLEADLARGRRALRRRRGVQTVASAALAVAAVLAGFTFTRGAAQPDGPDGRAVDVPAAAPATKLVAYTGEQPADFTIDKVPNGYSVRSDDNGVVVLGPEDEQGRGPDADPFRDPDHGEQAFAGKVRISVETTDGMNIGVGTGIKVAGKEGIFTKGPTGMPNADVGWSVWVLQGPATYLIVYFGKGFKLDRAEMIDVAAGVTVREDAKRKN
jgi:hypothetical protein